MGQPWATFLGQVLIQDTDLCVIPGRWLEHIPYWDSLKRAEFAVQLVEAHLSTPIRLYGARDKENLEAIREMERSWIQRFRAPDRRIS